MVKTVVKETRAMREIAGQELLRLAQTDPLVYILDGDLASSTKTDLVEQSCPEKFLQMGIAEQNMMGVASGMASVGLQPWVTTFAAFLSRRCLDQIQVVVAQPKMNVKMIGAYAGILNGHAGKTHQAIEDVAIMRSLANMIVLAPADTTELVGALQYAHEVPGPVYIRVARDPVSAVFPDGYRFQAAKAVLLRDGNDLTLISTGTQTHRTLLAAEELEEEGISAAVLHVPTIKPLDVNSVIEAAKRTGKVISTEEHTIIGGLGSAVAETLAEHYPVPMIRLGVEDRNIQSGPNAELLDEYGLSAEMVKKKVRQFLATR